MSTDEASRATTRDARADFTSARGALARRGPTARVGVALLGVVAACAGSPGPAPASAPDPAGRGVVAGDAATSTTVARSTAAGSTASVNAAEPLRAAFAATTRAGSPPRARAAIALEVDASAAPLERGLALVAAARIAERLVDVGLDAWSPATRQTLGAPRAERVRIEVTLASGEPARARVLARRMPASDGVDHGPTNAAERAPRGTGAPRGRVGRPAEPDAALASHGRGGFGAGTAGASPRPTLTDRTGPLEELDAAARAIAIAIVSAHAEALDGDAPDRVASRAATPLPAIVERALALAEDEVTFGDPRRARVHFDALDELRAPHLPAFVGTGPFRAARAAGVALGDKAELAASLIERAEEARDPRARAEAWRAFVKLTPERGALIDVALPPSARVVGDAASGAWVRDGGQTWALVAASPPRLDASVPAGLTPIARLGDDVLVAAARAVERHGRGGRRSQVALPVAPTALHAYPGQLAVVAPGFLGWIDPAIAQLVRTRRGIRVRALGPEGALVDGPSGLELVRPGRDAPTWVARRGPGTDAAPLHASASATVAAVASRVLLLDAGALELVDTYDGRARGAPLRLAPGLRWLGGRGRFGAIADADDRVHLVDVLEGTRRATIEGPGRPTAAIGTASGLALGFASGDVLFVDGDGALVDRLRVDGAVRALHAWDVPGVHEAVLVEAEGRALVTAVPAPDAARRRDVDGWLAIAQRALDDGDARAALRAAEPVAWATLGRVAEAEALRARAAERIGDEALARRARGRAARARVVAEPLPWR